MCRPMKTKNLKRILLKLYKLKLALKVLLLLACSKASSYPMQNQSKVHILIKSTFKRNKRIWGTYKQVSERVTSRKNNQDHTNEISYSKNNGNLIFQDGKAIFVRPVHNDRKTKLEVVSLPYTKMKASKKNYYIDVSGQKSEVYSLYKNILGEMLKNNTSWNNLSNDQRAKIIKVENNIKCKKIGLKFDCSVPITVDFT